MHVSQKAFAEALAGSRFAFWKAVKNIRWCRFIREWPARTPRVWSESWEKVCVLKIAALCVQEKKKSTPSAELLRNYKGSCRPTRKQMIILSVAEKPRRLPLRPIAKNNHISLMKSRLYLLLNRIMSDTGEFLHWLYGDEVEYKPVWLDRGKFQHLWYVPCTVGPRVKLNLVFWESLTSSVVGHLLW